jgi:hypothetical protein
MPINQVIETLKFLHPDGAVFEVCALGLKAPTSKLWSGRAYGKKPLAAGWFKDPAVAAKLAVQIEAEGVYTTLNPCHDAMLARADHRLKANVDRTADQHISSIKNLLVDVDATRPAGVSSTDAEHEAALEMVQVIKTDLANAGWPEPLVGDSGNGAHLIYPLDLPNTQESIDLVKGVLGALALRHQEQLVRLNLEIDQTVCNPSRLTKLYGTMVRKGDTTPDRPHRRARIISLPEVRQPVLVELLKKLAATAAAAGASRTRAPGPDQGRLDVEAYLNYYHREMVKIKPHQGGQLYCLAACVFNSDHTENEAAIFQAADGTLYYQCFHNSCKGKRTWAKARAIISGADKLDRFIIGGTPRRAPAPQPREAIHDPETGMAQIAQLNQKHAVVMLGGKCVILNEVIDPTFNRPDITFSTVQDFKNYYANVKIEVPTEKGTTLEPIGKIWLTSPMRRQYEGIVFCPGQDIPGFYNLFRGFAVKPVPGDWSLMRNHIQEVIANANQEHFKYLHAWMARLVQDPGGERAGVSVALRGELGSGKGCYASEFGKIFGPHFLHITNPTHLVHRFNNHLKDCLLCFVDEGIWAGDRTAEGILKGMITEQHIMVEPKGKDAFPVKNHIHLIIASNSEWIVPAGFEERRFLVLDVSNKHKQDHQYFAAIFEQMDHGGREAMLYDLLEMNLDVDLRKIPRTSALLDQVIYSMPTVHKFWLERLRAGTLLDEHWSWEPYVITEKLHRAYLEFADNCGDRYKLIDRQFGKEIKKICPEVKRGRKIIGGREKWVLYIPELATCREHFENKVKVKVNWKADVDESGLPF